MRAFSILALTGIVLVSLGFDHHGDEVPDMSQYWLGLIHKGDTWSADGGAEAMDLQRRHLESIGRLVESGELLLAGPFGDDGELRGLFIYDVATREEAEELVQMDPAVQSGHLTVELHPWWGPTALRGLAAAAGRDDDDGYDDDDWHDDDHGHDDTDDDDDGDDDDGDEHGHDDDGHGHGDR